MISDKQIEEAAINCASLKLSRPKIAWVLQDVRDAFKEGANWMQEKNDKEIEQLKQRLEIAVEALEWIAKTDTASVVHGPDIIWLTNWRNTRKQAAQSALTKISAEKEQ